MMKRQLLTLLVLLLTIVTQGAWTTLTSSGHVFIHKKDF